MIGGEVVSTLNDLAQKSIKCSLILTESRSSKDYKVFDGKSRQVRSAQITASFKPILRSKSVLTVEDFEPTIGKTAIQAWHGLLFCQSDL